MHAVRHPSCFDHHNAKPRPEVHYTRPWSDSLVPRRPTAPAAARQSPSGQPLAAPVQQQRVATAPSGDVPARRQPTPPAPPPPQRPHSLHGVAAVSPRPGPKAQQLRRTPRAADAAPAMQRGTLRLLGRRHCAAITAPLAKLRPPAEAEAPLRVQRACPAHCPPTLSAAPAPTQRAAGLFSHVQDLASAPSPQERADGEIFAAARRQERDSGGIPGTVPRQAMRVGQTLLLWMTSRMTRKMKRKIACACFAHAKQAE